MANDIGLIDLSEQALLAQLKELVQVVVEDNELERVDIDTITTETELATLPLDSLATVELMYGIEERFDISVTEDRAFEFRTVGNVIEFIREKRAAVVESTAMPGSKQTGESGGGA